MLPEFMYQTYNPLEVAEEYMVSKWPQARGELLGMALAMEQEAPITAEQLRMAITLADKEHDRLLKTVK